MIELRGRAVSGGTAIGPVFVQSSRASASSRGAESVPSDALVVEAAVARAKAQLEVLRETAGREAGADAAEILEVQRMMLDDPDYRERICMLMRERGLAAEVAIRQAGEYFARTFAESGDDYLQARADDVRDVSNRLIACLEPVERLRGCGVEPFVLVAEEILPSQLMQFDRRQILATVSVRGSANSHASILARARGIPAVVNVPIDLNAIRPGMRTLVDGTEGRVVFGVEQQPGQRTSSSVDYQPSTSQPPPSQPRNPSTSQPPPILANISGLDDLAEGLPEGFAGVGLFRTEFLYLGRPDLPTEEEQFRVYREVLERVGGREVVVRTFDLGADKTAESLPCAAEANPALGCRGIRFGFAHLDVLKTQIRALLRAAACGDLRIMYPMIVSCEEVARIKAFVSEAAAELKREGVVHRVPCQGVMIETPAAALISDELARMVDFFSIGTNDLTQYTLAMDREGGWSDGSCSSRHPAILRLIRMTVENAHRAGIPVSVCGELAADKEMADTFLGLHVDSLSVSP